MSDWFSRRFSSYYWHGNREERTIYLTFDDGPTPEVTDFVMEQLDKFQYKATFFCIGEKVKQFPKTYDKLLENGHIIGNHTQHHLNAWKTSSETYLEDVTECAKHIDSNLFRPPYGRIKRDITKNLIAKGYKIILWDVLSGDFDMNRAAASCLKNLKKNTKNGSVIVFHDSEKSFEKLKQILPEYLSFIESKGWKSKSIS
ncbi:polysaccharide deacetylase family protein [Nonlabens sp.]|uniref:polysaccharide deacetylase family protein n=1 Tax=Nonlabens sp. TaxID=1888209 RepID=UPI003F6A530B